MARSDLELPADLVTEILLKLPVKSMIRFRCVAKTWYHLLKSPTFVSQHLSLSKKNRSNSHLVVHYRRDNLIKKIGMLSFTKDQTLVFYHDLHQRLPSHLAGKQFVSLAVGDGLVCLYDSMDSGMTLWNPATKESRILPDCKPHITRRKDDHVYPLLGCGIDPLSNDYKVLYLYARKYSRRREFKGYAIYRMSSDSWRVLKEEDVEIVEKLASVDPNKGNSCVNGVCYWQVVHPWRWDHSEFLTFHLSTGVFRLLRSPPGTCGELIPLHDGRIAFWESSNVDPRTDPGAVWVSNDAENWTKLINIDPLPQVLTIYGLWTHGKVFVDRKDGELSVYSLETGGVDESGFEANCAWVYNYEESLVAVNRE